MNKIAKTLQRFGADEASIRLFQNDGPDLLPYATLLTARGQGNTDLMSVEGVYEWQNTPLMFLVDANQVDSDVARLHRIRRMVAMRGDAPYLGVIAPGRLEVYRVSLDALRPADVRVDLGLAEGQEITALAHLGNTRPGLDTGNRQWISHVVLKLLSSSIDRLQQTCNVSDEDSISLVGRALFTRFLGDRHLLSALNIDDQSAAELFDSPTSARKTSEWLDATFNGDFLPVSSGIFKRLPPQAYQILGDILRRAPEGQLYLGWQERWNNLDFAHIPVGVLSQAYEHYLHTHAPSRQRKEGGYYTPRPIAELMVRGAFHALSRESRVDTAKVLDPAAGAGVFLLTAFRQLVAEKWKHNGTRPNTKILREILYKQITGFDINEAALRFAALGLYLMSIELDPHPEPVKKLRFENLRGTVLHKIEDGKKEERGLGSLGFAVGDSHIGRYDLVVGNPPWSTGTRLPNWGDVESIVGKIALKRLAPESPTPPIPNEALDLPFVWRAMEWAKPKGQIAFALHARLLFQQGDGMQEARRALFEALDVTAVVNGVELRQTRVWPQISAPFCLLYARNAVPSPSAGFRLVSPHLESNLNDAGQIRIDASNAELITCHQVAERPELLKILFRGGQSDLQTYDRIISQGLLTLSQCWEYYSDELGRELPAGNGYQKLRESSRPTKGGDGQPGMPSQYLLGMPDLTIDALNRVLILKSDLVPFKQKRVHRRRSQELYSAPLLLIHQSPPASEGRIRVAVADEDIAFNETFYGYSAQHHRHGKELVRYLALVVGSKTALWQALITSGKFGFEREVIEKSTIDNILIPSFENLSAKNRKQVALLFDAAKRDDNGCWDRIDRWVADLYRLRPRDLQVIADTLRYNLPFAANRNSAQAKVSEKDVRRFCSTLNDELRPWGERFGRAMEVLPSASLKGSPWRSLRICSNAQSLKSEGSDWANFFRAANSLAATEVLYSESSDCLWIARLDQARYWSDTQAREVARRLVWSHLGFLKGQEA